MKKDKILSSAKKKKKKTVKRENELTEIPRAHITIIGRQFYPTIITCKGSELEDSKVPFCSKYSKLLQGYHMPKDITILFFLKAKTLWADILCSA